jgi:arylsulfatase A-like enzyme
MVEISFGGPVTQKTLLDESVEPTSEKASVRPKWLPLVALASIMACLCLSLEIDLVEQIDSLLLYMSYRQIALDLAVALLILLGMGVLWWGFVLSLAGIAQLIPEIRPYRESLFWRVSLVVPLAYLLVDIFGAARLRFLPEWHPNLWGWTLLILAFIAICVIGVFLPRLDALQAFVRARLAPIGCLHVGLGLIAVIALWRSDVHLFHNYIHPARTDVTSQLPDIYLITIDALRAEDMSLYGYRLPTTPNLERFGSRSFVFDHFFANSNFTTPTTTSIETGQLPWSHRVFQGGGFPIPSVRQRTLPAALRQHGYYTAMVTSNYLASPPRHRTLQSYDAVEYDAPTDWSGAWLKYTNLIGTNAQYTSLIPLMKGIGGIRNYLDALVFHDRYPYPAEAVFDGARGLLGRQEISQPRFLWAHIFPPHDPYLPPSPYIGKFLEAGKLTHNYDFIGLRNDTLPRGVSKAELRARYDEIICYADQQVGGFLNWLDQTGRLDRSIVIVSADHGESFEHDWFLHTGPYLHHGLIDIPLIIHLPDQKQGRRIQDPAEQVDLQPTILDLIGAEAPLATDGVSLKPALEGRPMPERFLFSMNLEPNRASEPISKGTIAVIDDQFKYVEQLGTGKQSLYRYRIDPLEDNDLVGLRPEIASHLHDVLMAKIQEVNEWTLQNRIPSRLPTRDVRQYANRNDGLKRNDAP